MTALRRLLALLALVAVLALAFPAPALAANPARLIIGNSFTLPAGETLDEGLTIIGGTVTLEQDSKVNGDILILGGTLTIDGEVDGSLTALGGVLQLLDHAVIHGDVATAGASLARAEGAVINGSIQSESSDAYTRGLPPGLRPQAVQQALAPLWWLGRSLLLAVLAMLAAMFTPRPLERTAQAFAAQPLIAGALGLLTLLVLPLILIILIITLIGIPIAALLVLLLAFAWLFGWLAAGYEVGRRLARSFNRSWAEPVSAGAGTLLLSLLAGALSAYIPCIGWLLPAFVGLAALGAVLLTRMGTQPYPLPLPEVKPPSISDAAPQ